MGIFVSNSIEFAVVSRSSFGPTQWVMPMGCWRAEWYLSEASPGLEIVLLSVELLGYSGAVGRLVLCLQYECGVVSCRFVPHHQEPLQTHQHKQSVQTAMHDFD